MMQKKLLIVPLTIAFAAILTAWLIYPGLYIYIPVANTTEVYRINRVTGEKQLASQWGWKTEAEYLALYSAQEDREEAAFDAKVKEFARDAGAGRIERAMWTGGRLTVQYRDGHYASAVVNVLNQPAIERANDALVRHHVTVAQG
jgi:hypothetical protein